MSNGNDDGGRILILGGTGEARALAGRLVAMGYRVTTSLAGRTREPVLPEGKVRVGGFGGAEGLAAYLFAERVELLVDATHPFAARIKAHAVAASGAAEVPLVRLERPAWERPDGAAWIEVRDMAGAAAALPGGARVLLTIGRQEVGAFFSRTDCLFVARMIEAAEGVPEDWRVIRGRGPFAVEEEMAAMAQWGITHVVSKNSGGTGTGKIEAAARLGVPVVMVRRPVLPAARTGESVEEVVGMVISGLARGAPPLPGPPHQGEGED